MRRQTNLRPSQRVVCPLLDNLAHVLTLPTGTMASRVASDDPKTRSQAFRVRDVAISMGGRVYAAIIAPLNDAINQPAKGTMTLP